MRANFQFEVAPNYHQQVFGKKSLTSLKSVCSRVYALDLSPTDGVDWKLVTKVIKRVIGEGQCPVCLNTPKNFVAPQITPCGHIFCFPCILRHLETS